MDLNILRTPKKAQHTANKDLTRTFRASSLAPVSGGFLLSRMNPSDAKRQKTAARKIRNELVGKVFQKVALPVQFFQFMGCRPSSIPLQRGPSKKQDEEAGGNQDQHHAMV